MLGVGGAEWLIIIGVIVLLFVPSAAFFAVGYFVGKRSGGQGAASPSAGAPSAPADATADDCAQSRQGDSDA